MFDFGSIGTVVALVFGGIATVAGMVWRAYVKGKASKQVENDYEDAQDYIDTTRRINGQPDSDLDDDEWLRRHSVRSKKPTNKR